MGLFLDTSALVKLFAQEPGALAVERAVGHDPEILVGWLAPHEFLSAVQRKRRNHVLTEANAGKLVAAFRATLLTSVTLIPYHDAQARRALDLLEQLGSEGLRTLDAFQLACALERPRATFGISDKTLAGIARKAGLNVAYFA